VAHQDIAPAVPVAVHGAHLVRVFRNCLIEARPAVQGIFLMRFFAGALLSAHFSMLGVTRVVAGALAWWFATVVVYLLNGITDVTEDRLNSSARPVARGELSTADATSVCWALSLFAVILAAFDGGGLLPLLLAFLGLGYLYSVPPFALKARTMGASTVAGLGGLVTYCAGFVVSGGNGDLLLLGGVAGSRAGLGGAAGSRVGLVFALAMSGWMGLVGAQAKDLPDAVGDAIAGRRTIAVRWGARSVRAVLAAIALAVGGCFVLVAGRVAPPLLPAAWVVLAGAVVLTVTVLSPYSRGSRSRLRRPYRVFMATQYAAHLVLAGTVLALA
jgi:4-hydroxybenzoate polyprenyltransferase